MPIHFDSIEKGSTWDRKALARIWGYRSFHAIARGVITPTGQNVIVLFVTEQKQESLTPYEDELVGQTLHWEGEEGHQNDLRIRDAEKSGDQIHVFHRFQHHAPFFYLGKAHLKSATLRSNAPSKFTFELEGD